MNAWAWVVAYLAFGALVIWTQPTSGAALWYPPLAIGIGMLLRHGLVCAPLILACEAVITHFQYRQGFTTTAIVAGNSVFEAVLATIAIRSLLMATKHRLVVRYPLAILVAGGAVTFMGATTGTLLLSLSSDEPWTLHLSNWIAWWVGDAASVICFLPLFLMWDRPDPAPRFALPAQRMREAALILAGMAAALVMAVLLTRFFASYMRGIPWVVCFLPLLWVALRVSGSWTALFIAIFESAMVLSFWWASHHHDADRVPPLAHLQIFMCVVSISGITLALAMESERQIRRDVESASLAIAQNEARLRSILDNMIEGCQILDRDYRYTYLNSVAVQQSRQTLEQLIGVRIQEAYPGVENTLLFERMRTVMEQRVAILCESEFDFPDGTRGNFQLSIQPSPEGIMILSYDVTQAKQQEREANKNAKLLHAVVEGSADLISVKDLQGRYVLLNPAGARSFGVATDAVLGKTDADFLNVESARLVLSLDRRAIDGNASFVQDYEVRSLDGRHQTYLTMKAPLLDESGNVAGVITIGRDVTELRRAEQALAASEARYRAVFEHANDALFVIQQDDLIVDANRAACELLGLNRAQLRGVNRHQLGLPLDADFDTGDSVHPHADVSLTTIRRPDGTAVPVEFRRRRIESDDLALDLLVGRDLTRQRHAEEAETQHRGQIAHLSRVASVGELASSLAHELNQPLSAILSYASVLRDDCLARGSASIALEAHEYLSDIVHQALRAAEIIRGIRRFIHKDRGSLADLDINDAVRNALKLLRYEVRDANVALSLDLQDQLPLVPMDSVQIEQVIINLAHNALEAMSANSPGNRALRISTRASAEGVEVTVTDTGPGVAPEVADRLFEPFFTTKATGLGLGLAICRSIVEAHGGHLTMEPGTAGGTTFSFRLPLPVDITVQNGRESGQCLQNR